VLYAGSGSSSTRSSTLPMRSCLPHRQAGDAEDECGRSRRAPPQFKAGGLTLGLYRLGSNNVQGALLLCCPCFLSQLQHQRFHSCPLLHSLSLASTALQVARCYFLRYLSGRASWGDERCSSVQAHACTCKALTLRSIGKA
jgi:hypothetical protein